MGVITEFSLLLLAVSAALAQQTCPGSFPQFEPTIDAKGFKIYVIAKNLTGPRSLVFDKDDNLLVVERSKGVTALKLKEENNCMSVVSQVSIINDATVCALAIQKSDSNHKIVESWSRFDSRGESVVCVQQRGSEELAV
jgi:glucose/arabinose dehydrogenase